MSELCAVGEIYAERERRAKELKLQGAKILGYLSCYVPVEIMTAAGVLPYRIMSTCEPITVANSYLESIACPFIRSCFDEVLRGKYSFLDGAVIPHNCDIMEKLFEMWVYNLESPYCFFLDMPHMIHPSSFSFYKNELSRFRKSLEKLVETEVSDQSLRDAIVLHNENRALMRRLYSLRKQSPPFILGSEMMNVAAVAMSLPVHESNQLLEDVYKDVLNRQGRLQDGRLRLLVHGSDFEYTDFLELVEESGADVVMDDHSMGTRVYWHDVQKTLDPLEGLAKRYLGKVLSPRTYQEGAPADRFAYLLDYVREFKVDGVILYVNMFCDTHELDAPDLRDFLEEAGIPVLHIEGHYGVNTSGQLRTRVQAFLELMA